MAKTGYNNPSNKYGAHAETFSFINQEESDLIHTSLSNDKDLVLGIVAECKNGDFSRFHELNDAGIDWVRHYTIVSDKTWVDWKKGWKKYNRSTAKVAQQ